MLTRPERLVLIAALVVFAAGCLAPSDLPEGLHLFTVVPGHGFVLRDVPGLAALGAAAYLAYVDRRT